MLHRGKGYQQDNDVNLYNVRKRYYDFATGQWVNEDPLGFKAGDPNLYCYAFNDPVNHVDPSGMLILVAWDQVVPGGYSYAGDTLRDQFHSACTSEFGPRESIRFKHDLVEINDQNSGCVNLGSLPSSVVEKMRESANAPGWPGGLNAVYNAHYLNPDHRVITALEDEHSNLAWDVVPSPP
jgi:RHS repeat-associated protein